jgi:hypothetical protein
MRWRASSRPPADSKTTAMYAMPLMLDPRTALALATPESA